MSFDDEDLDPHGECRHEIERLCAELAGLGGLAEDMAKALEGMLKLADMGLEESMQQPEENGNFAAYNRARAALERFRAAKKEQA